MHTLYQSGQSASHANCAHTGGTNGSRCLSILNTEKKTRPLVEAHIKLAKEDRRQYN